MRSCIRSEANFPGLWFAFLGLLASGMAWHRLVAGLSHRSSLPTQEAPPGRPTPSLGCRVESQKVFADAGGLTISVDAFEPAFNKSIKRSYVLDHSRGTKKSTGSYKPAPLLLVFHGQHGNSTEELLSFRRAGLDELEEEDDFILVAPQGLADSTYGPGHHNNGEPDQGTGWNVGTGGDENTCSLSHQGDKPATKYSCYKSCVELNQCGRCNWSTCHDDVALVKSILIQVSETHCIDLTRIYALGRSNGGMFVHYLAEKMPETFAALVPIFGLPLQGHLHLNSDALQETALLELHDRGDRIIPVKGGMSPDFGWEWYYEPLEEVVAAWANIHDCQAHATQLAKSSQCWSFGPWHFCKSSPVVEPGQDNFQCTEHASCKSGRRVISCLYGTPGHHGDWPHGHVLGKITNWFFKQFRRTSVAPWLLGDTAFAKVIYM